MRVRGNDDQLLFSSTFYDDNENADDADDADDACYTNRLCNLQNFTEELKKEKDSQPLKVVCLNAENSLYLTS